ncbi:MAG: adenylate/guanylate cyclase domain-containing protein [Polyangiaceae bacterium]
MARLILTTAEGTHAVDLRPVNSLGRHPNNTIQLLDKIVSKEHCIIELRNGDQFVLRDLGSLNGTYVNNERVRGESPLRHGDEIALGATRGRFDDGSSPLPPLSPAAPQASQGAPVPSQQPAQQPPHYPQPHAGQQPGQQGWQAPQPGKSPMANSQSLNSQGGAFQGQPQGQNPQFPPQPAFQAGPSQVPGQPYRPPSPGYGQQQGAPSYRQAPPASAGANAPPRPQSYPPPAYGQQNAYGQQYGQQGYGQGQYPNQNGPNVGYPGYGGQPGYPAQANNTASRSVGTFLAQGTRIDVNDQARQIGTQIDAVEKGFVAFDRIANDMNQLRADYERLRLSHELSHAIGIERDTQKLLEKILASVLKFITADRAVIFLRDDESGELRPQATQRRDGTTGPITISSTILDHVVKERAAVLTHDAAMDFAASKGKSMILNRISSAIVAPLLQHDNEVLGVLWLDSEILARFQAKDLELVQTVANQAARFIEINILGKKVEAEIVNRERLSRLLSPNIAEQVINGKLEVKPGGQRVEECTVFNSDIRGFTRMSESTSPEQLVVMLNDYFETMVDTIFKYDGTLDKFMGDGIMALWGAPLQTPEDAIRSVECALEMSQALGALNRKRLDRSEDPLAVGIGIHTGPLVAGYIGSSKALSYTVIGDTANTSARLCSHALAGHIIVSENTLARLRNKFEVAELPSAKVKGKEKPLRIYNVLKATTKVAVPGGFAAEPTSAVVPPQ